MEFRPESLLPQLTLEEKVGLLTGTNFWQTAGIERIGLRSMLLSDGPSGVRGERWDEREPSVNLPSATALASSWDPEIARRYGAVAAAQARRKGVDVVLGPTINLHRSPLGGRHFEAFSEDPVLTGELAVGYVRGLQDNGVAATPKHYVANDSETDRMTVDVRVDERTLRELYLAPFERVVRDGGAWALMSAYNSVNGVTCTENDLLETPLNDEWGFDGVVISDWTAVRRLAAAVASQDLAMPGPEGAWGPALVDAVRAGGIPEAAIDRKVVRILRLAARVGALAPAAPAPVTDDIPGDVFAREAAIEGMVLLENRGELPWEPAAIGSVAVIGEHAAYARTQGGGSATVIPAYTVSPLDGLRAALPGADVRWSRGVAVQDGIVGLPQDRMTNPVTGESGLQVRFLDDSGAELYAEDRRSGELTWLGGAAPIRRTALYELSTRYTPGETVSLRLGFAGAGSGRLFVDDDLVLEAELAVEGLDFASAILTPPFTSTDVELTAGRPVTIRLDFRPTPGGIPGAISVKLGYELPISDPQQLIDDAVAAARAADVAVVVVGTSAEVESEGFDRTSLALPGRQDDLVRAVAAANPRTVVVVNAGSPVLLPWRDQVKALLVTFFGGQEIGNALAEVLLGVREPGGRLTTTWPAAEADVPVLSTAPVNGQLEYAEGLNIGYRAWLAAGRQPAYWFGAGTGYAQVDVVSVEAASVVAPEGDLDVRIQVRNASDRAGKQVVQVYAERPDPGDVQRPPRWLVGSGVIRVPANSGAELTVRVPSRRLGYWEPGKGWSYEAGPFALHVGTSMDPTPFSLAVTVGE